VSPSGHPPPLILFRSPRAMARLGGLHGVGVYVLLAGAFLPIADFFIVKRGAADDQRFPETLSGRARTGCRRLRCRVCRHAGVGWPAGRPASAGTCFSRLGSRALSSRRCSAGWRRRSKCSSRRAWHKERRPPMLAPQVLAICHVHLAGERKARAMALYGATREWQRSRASWLADSW